MTIWQLVGWLNSRQPTEALLKEACRAYGIQVSPQDSFGKLKGMLGERLVQLDPTDQATWSPPASPPPTQGAAPGGRPQPASPPAQARDPRVDELAQKVDELTQLLRQTAQPTPAAPAPATPTQAPQVPTGVTAVAGDTQITLSWQPVANAALYIVLRRLNGSQLQEIGRVSSLGFVDTGLTNGTTYYYAVSSVNAAGQESGDSMLASATPQPGAQATQPKAKSPFQEELERLARKYMPKSK